MTDVTDNPISITASVPRYHYTGIGNLVTCLACYAVVSGYEFDNHERWHLERNGGR
jgi:hypothetical protein